MLKFTKPSVIAFDFKEALSFEGETGPYAQYAVVRATNIFRKGGFDPEIFGGRETSRVSGPDFAKYLDGESGNDIWELWLAAAKTSYIVANASRRPNLPISPSMLFNWRSFSTLSIIASHLEEPDEDRKNFLLMTAAVVRRELIRVLTTMGIDCARQSCEVSRHGRLTRPNGATSSVIRIQPAE